MFFNPRKAKSGSKPKRGGSTPKRGPSTSAKRGGRPAPKKAAAKKPASKQTKPFYLSTDAERDARVLRLLRSKDKSSSTRGVESFDVSSSINGSKRAFDGHEDVLQSLRRLENQGKVIDVHRGRVFIPVPSKWD